MSSTSCGSPVATILLIEIVTNNPRDFHEFLEKEIHIQPDIALSETMSGLKISRTSFCSSMTLIELTKIEGAPMHKENRQ